MSAPDIVWLTSFLFDKRALALPSGNAHRAHGSILVLVLVTLLLFSTVALHVTQRAVHVTQDHILLVQAVQAGMQAEAAMDKVVELLSRASESVGGNNPLDRILEWQEHGIRITITPANAKLNLNALHPPLLQPQGEGRLQQTVSRMLDDHAPQANIQDVLHWLGHGFNPDTPRSNLAIDAPYAAVQADYRPRKAPLQRPEELLLVRGLEELDPDWVREHFTVWGRDGRINLNFASREVLLELLPELEAYWPAIEQHRGEHGFRRLDELIARIRLPMDVYQRVLPHIALHSDIYEASVEIRQPAWYERHRIIMERTAILDEAHPRILAADILESRPLEEVRRPGE